MNKFRQAVAENKDITFIRHNDIMYYVDYIDTEDEVILAIPTDEIGEYGTFENLFFDDLDADDELLVFIREEY